MATRKNATKRRRSPLKGKRHKEWGTVHSHLRRVAGKNKRRKVGSAVNHQVCTIVPDGMDLVLVKSDSAIGKRAKRNKKKRSGVYR